MFVFQRPTAACFAAIVLGVTLNGCGGGGSSSPTPPAPAAPSSVKHAAPLSSTRSNAPFRYAVHPHVMAISGDLILRNCSGSNQAYLQCATPTAIKGGYNFPASGGKGQTIAIVDPFGSPTIANDLKAFDTQFTLTPMDPSEGASCPSLASTPDGNPRFTVYYPGGKPTFNPSDATQVGFAEETSLDVEWAHAAAPSANILLVVPPNDQGQTVQSAQAAAIACPGVDVLSLSFGALESSINGGANNTQLQQAESNYAAAKTNHITVIASAGDLGATAGGAMPDPEYPATSPSVLAVGGTNLILKRNTNYNNESVWNDTNNCIDPCSDANAPGATGGAPSSIFNALTDTFHASELSAWSAYQQKYYPGIGPTVRRWTSDVAYNASPNTGVVVYISFLQQYGLTTNTTNAYAVGGTSQGPPQWAGIIATANASRGSDLGFVNEKLYKIFAQDAKSLTTTPAFHDVTVGNNNYFAANGYAAITGWDPPTGLGSANVGNLLTALANPTL